MFEIEIGVSMNSDGSGPAAGMQIEHIGDGVRRYTVRRAPSSAPWLLGALGAAGAAAAASSALPPAVGVGALLLPLGALAHAALSVREESLLVIQGLGVQLSTRFWGRAREEFADVAAISEVFLGEAVRLDRCHFYLACLLHGESAAPRLIVAFPHLRPRLVELERCYRGVRAVLWGEAEADAGAGDAVT